MAVVATPSAAPVIVVVPAKAAVSAIPLAMLTLCSTLSLMPSETAHAAISTTVRVVLPAKMARVSTVPLLLALLLMRRTITRLILASIATAAVAVITVAVCASIRIRSRRSCSSRLLIHRRGAWAGFCLAQRVQRVIHSLLLALTTVLVLTVSAMAVLTA